MILSWDILEYLLVYSRQTVRGVGKVQSGGFR